MKLGQTLSLYDARMPIEDSRWFAAHAPVQQCDVKIIVDRRGQGNGKFSFQFYLYTLWKNFVLAKVPINFQVQLQDQFMCGALTQSKSQKSQLIFISEYPNRRIKHIFGPSGILTWPMIQHNNSPRFFFHNLVSCSNPRNLDFFFDSKTYLDRLAIEFCVEKW